MLKALEKHSFGWICKSNEICFFHFFITLQAEINRNNLSVLCLPGDLLPDVGICHS